MPPRSTPPRSLGYPLADHATFRDLKIFEERLKDTAASLQRRKSRYQLFLFQLLTIITLLLLEVFLPPQSSILVIPYKSILQWLLPEVYTPDTEVTLHPYFTSGLLFVSVTTLVLFFASGMYSEKIAYANKYVPHANRSLRSFNMYFNTRKPSLRSKIRWNPFSLFFARPDESHTHFSSRPSSPSPNDVSGRHRSHSGSRPIPTIPPASNPRGELIFSSRVDKMFREGYERYRTAFEKKRQEQQRSQKWGWLYRLKFWDPQAGLTSQPTPMRSASGSLRGRGIMSRSATPPVLSSNQASTEERSRSPTRRASRKRSSNVTTRKIDTNESGFWSEQNDETDMRVQTLERRFAQGAPS